MRKSIIFSMFLLFFTAGLLFSQRSTYSFSYPQINTDDEGVTEVVYESCIHTAKAGAPILPYKGINILLPQNHILTGVEIVSVSYYDDLEDVLLRPAIKPQPISLYDGIQPRAIPDEDIYSLVGPWPTNTVGNSSTQFLSGHGIASFTLCPMEYYPAEKRLRLIKEIVIEVKSKSDKTGREAVRFLRTDASIQKRLKRLVSNEETLGTYHSASDLRDEPYDILLISSAALLPEFTSYLEYKESTGYFVKSISVEDIYAQYSGADDQEMIRNCIIDYYTNSGISYVILAGDADPATPADRIIPHRGFSAVDDDDIPSDMYYSNLDGSWDSNGNGIFGEAGEDDLYSEVSIGRICVDKASEVQNFVNKLQLYQDAPVVDDIEKALFLGEELNSYTFGGTYKDEIVNGSDANGYTTVGLSPNISCTRLYEMQENWLKGDIFNQFSLEGVNLLNHLGHSNVTYNMKMYNSDLTTSNFTNDGITRGFAIGYSQGCYNGSFDNRETSATYTVDCFAENITTMETGEVACVSNSRYGWYHPGGTNSSSQYYDRLFFDAIFGKNIGLIGDVNAESKEDDVSYISNDQYWRWTAYETNLFGDPTLDIWTAIPTSISATYPFNIPIGSSSVDFETDAPGARIAVLRNGELIGRAIADDNGNASVIIPLITDANPLDVSIIAHNRNRHIGTIMVFSDTPYLIYDNYELNDASGNNNQQPDYGESLLLSLGIKNVGDQDAFNTMVSISSDDEYITISDDTEAYGIVGAGQTVAVSDAFAFDIADNVPDQHQLNIDIEMTSDEEWTANILLTALAPDIKITGLSIDDTLGGNANGNLDPGEHVSIIVHAINDGHSDAMDATASLTSSSDFISINTSSVAIGEMPTGQHITAVFDVETDDFAPTGAYADFNVELNSGNYNVSRLFNLTIGLIFENWETGDFSKFNWSSTSTWPWGMSMNNASEGDYCVCSGDINNDETSDIKLTYNCIADDSISFFRRVSSEEDCDFLQFFIDQELMAEWSGFCDWEKFTFPVSQGVHSFRWVYSKNEEYIMGDDCAWIDYIVFPPTVVTTCYAGADTSICVGGNYQCEASASNYTSLEWSTSGDGSFNDISITDAIYYPGSQDISNGEVCLTLTAFSNLPCGDIPNEMMLAFDPLPETPEEPEGPTEVDVYYSPSSDYSVNSAPYCDSYSWMLSPGEAGSIEANGINLTVNWNTDFLGNAYVSVKGINACGESDFSEEHEVIVYNTVGIPSEALTKEMFVHPNPNTGDFFISLKGFEQQNVEWVLLNAEGLRINNGIVNCEKSTKVHFTNLNIGAGIYYLKAQSPDTIIIKKIILID